MRKLTQLLDDRNIHYDIIRHAPAYTAQQIAATAHISGKHLVKTVMVELDNTMAMVILSADHQLDLQWLRETTGANNVRLANEYEFAQLFDDCETGAMPPFGNLFGIDVYVEDSLAQDSEIAFNAGNHSELIQMNYKDFERLVKPRILHH